MRDETLFSIALSTVKSKRCHCPSRNVYLCFELNSTLSAKWTKDNFRQRRIQTLKRVRPFCALIINLHHILCPLLHPPLLLPPPAYLPTPYTAPLWPSFSQNYQTAQQGYAFQFPRSTLMWK